MSSIYWAYFNVFCNYSYSPVLIGNVNKESCELWWIGWGTITKSKGARNTLWNPDQSRHNDRSRRGSQALGIPPKPQGFPFPSVCGLVTQADSSPLNQSSCFHFQSCENLPGLQVVKGSHLQCFWNCWSDSCLRKAKNKFCPVFRLVNQPGSPFLNYTKRTKSTPALHLETALGLCLFWFDSTF